MLRRIDVRLLLLFPVYLFTFCNEAPDDGYFYCVEAGNNATVTAVGYRADDSLLSVSFASALSYCSNNEDEYRYEVKRLDISLVTFEDTLLMEKRNEDVVYSLPQGSEQLFSGSINCNESCEIEIPLDPAQFISVNYTADGGEFFLEIDTNGVFAAEYPLSPRE